jgi:hypothetical protein
LKSAEAKRAFLGGGLVTQRGVYQRVKIDVWVTEKTDAEWRSKRSEKGASTAL